MYSQLLNSNSSPILELSIKFVSQICHKNINKPLDGAYLVDFGIDIRFVHTWPASNFSHMYPQRPADEVEIMKTSKDNPIFTNSRGGSNSG